jgi:hypothetical protein
LGEIGEAANPIIFIGALVFCTYTLQLKKKTIEAEGEKKKKERDANLENVHSFFTSWCDMKLITIF